jgi:hypothetical protein
VEIRVVLVDSNVLLDILSEDPQWFDWSSEKLAECADEHGLIINPIIYPEVSIGSVGDVSLPENSNPKGRARCPHRAERASMKIAEQ